MRLRAGSIVVLDRQGWRILEINGYPGNWWPDSYEKAWRDHVELWWHANELRRANNQAVKPAPERAEFYKRPVVLVLRNENLPRSTPKHWCAPASHDWRVLPEHYAVCRACGELPPCHHGEYRWEGGPRWPEQDGGMQFVPWGQAGDFELTVGQDFSIGYLDHSRTAVSLYLQESFTCRVLSPEAAIPLAYPAEGAKGR